MGTKSDCGLYEFPMGTPFCPPAHINRDLEPGEVAFRAAVINELSRFGSGTLENELACSICSHMLRGFEFLSLVRTNAADDPERVKKAVFAQSIIDQLRALSNDKRVMLNDTDVRHGGICECLPGHVVGLILDDLAFRESFVAFCRINSLDSLIVNELGNELWVLVKSFTYTLSDVMRGKF